MNRIKVLVVDDSAFMRKMISDILNSDPFIEVIGTARNGKDGIDKMEKLSPDVITLDIEMPIMDGLTALKNIMDRNPLPVVMLSSLTQEGAETTLKALPIRCSGFYSKTIWPHFVRYRENQGIDCSQGEGSCFGQFSINEQRK